MTFLLIPLFAHAAEERQITFTPKNHCLDNNDNFSMDGRFLCYDTRDTVGLSIENCQSIEKVEIATGKETVLCKAVNAIMGKKAAPGMGAVSFSPVENKVAFIHGPMVEEVPVRGYYGKPNRLGAEVVADGSGTLAWLDKRDVETSRPTIAGAHRGGTHRHEYSLDGKRIGFTYDDFILTQFERTVGYMEMNPKAPAGALCYFAILVPVVPSGTAKPGEIERAFSDSWIGRHGLMRGFIGKVKETDGTYQESLFVADIPADTDITTADSGSADRFPSPPKGIKIRRLTHDWAGGVIRGTIEGVRPPRAARIAYFGHAADGTTQIFVIPSDGSDRDANPDRRPVQATHFPKGVQGNLRWHPSGNYILCISDNAIVAVCGKAGNDFGKIVLLAPQGDSPARNDIVLSPDGKTLAFNKPMPVKDAEGKRLHTYNGADFVQIFVMDVPDLR